MNPLLSEKELMMVNNMEHVHRQLETLPFDLEVDRLLHAVEEQQGHVTADQHRYRLDTILREAQKDVMGNINGILMAVTDQMKAAVKKFVFHLAWAPEKLDPEKGLMPLMEYLETNMMSMYSSFLEANFCRVLESIWRLVLEEISVTARSNIGKEKPCFFERLSASLSILVEFFHADGRALPLSTIQNTTYQELNQELRLHKSNTPHLIELYFLQRLEDQTKLFHAPYGLLTVDAHYDDIKQCVSIEVVSARDIMPCDPNGLSDPFVILELVPKHLFPNSPQQKTKVHKKTLFPFFNEHFEFSAKMESCRANAAALSLVVMDYDYMRKNDFEGEAYVALNTLLGIDESISRESAPVELVLMHPRDKSDILVTLAMRPWDKDAVELLKQEKAKHS